MAAQEMVLRFPSSSPDWPMALRRIECLGRDEILDAASLLLSQWEVENQLPQPVEEIAARHFLLSELEKFSSFYDQNLDSEGVVFDALPPGPVEYRDPERGATVVLARLGVLQAAGFSVEADFVPFSSWPRGEEDPAFGLSAAS